MHACTHINRILGTILIDVIKPIIRVWKSAPIQLIDLINSCTHAEIQIHITPPNWLKIYMPWSCMSPFECLSCPLFSPSWLLGDDSMTTWLRPPRTDLRLIVARQHGHGARLLLPTSALHGGTTTWLWPFSACTMCPTAHTVLPRLVINLSKLKQLRMFA
jgi:hypothetical protein